MRELAALALALLHWCAGPEDDLPPDRSPRHPTVQRLVDGSCVQWVDGEPLALRECPEPW